MNARALPDPGSGAGVARGGLEGGGAAVDWPGPATDYDDAIAYYTNSSTAADRNRPLAGTESSTNTAAGLRLTRWEMERYLN